MIMNDHGVFQPNDLVKLVPYQHHLNRCMWMVFVDDGDLLEGITYFAAFAVDGEEAAEVGYSSYLKGIEAMEVAMKEDIQVASEWTAEDSAFSPLLAKERASYDEWRIRKRREEFEILAKEDEDDE